jgi:hypothetical protein
MLIRYSPAPQGRNTIDSMVSVAELLTNSANPQAIQITNVMHRKNDLGANFIVHTIDITQGYYYRVRPKIVDSIQDGAMARVNWRGCSVRT